MPWSGINHLAMVTPDMDETVRFYHDVLGMELVATVGHGDANEPIPYRHLFDLLHRPGELRLARSELLGARHRTHPLLG